MEVHAMSDATITRPEHRVWDREPYAGLLRFFFSVAAVVGICSVTLAVIVWHESAASDARRADLSARCERIGASLHEATLDAYCVAADGTIKGVPPKRP